QGPTQPVQPPTSKPAVQSSCLVVFLGIFIAAGVFLTIFFWPHPSANQHSIDAHLVSPPFIGSNTMLYGEYFTPDEVLIISIDQSFNAVAQGAKHQATMNLAGLTSSQTPQDQTNEGFRLTVGKNGIFTTPIWVSNSWMAGSQHKIFIYDQQFKLLKTIAFNATQRTFQASLQGCATNAITIGPVLEDATKPATTSVALCTTGNGPVTWSAQANAPWLTLPQNGQVQAPARGSLLLQASAKGLQPGSYKTTLNLSSKESRVTVTLDVYFSVLKKGTNTKPSPTPVTSHAGVIPEVQPHVSCLSVDQNTLSFSALERQKNMLYHALLLSNCGDTGTWSGTVKTDNGQSWLQIGAAPSVLAPGGNKDIAIDVSSANLTQGSYKGHVQFWMGKESRQIDVTFTVYKQPQTSCLNVSPQSLLLRGVSGQNSVDSRVFLANCGAAGRWTGSVQTNDYTNWLTIATGKHTLKEGELQPIDLNASALQLWPGVYTARIILREGMSTVQINVTFVVEAPCFRVSSRPLFFHTREGDDSPTAQSIWIENCGTRGAWYASAITNNGADWLHIDQSNGLLKAGGVQQISVSVSNDHVKGGIYTGQILIATGPTLSVIPVTFFVQPPHPPRDCISVSDSELDFTVTQGQGESDAQTLTIGNCGSKGRWNASVGDDVSWLHLSSTGNFLQSQQDNTIQITTSGAKLKKGTYEAHVRFTLGTSSRTVTIHLTVQPPAIVTCIRADTPSISLTGYLNSHELVLTDQVKPQIQVDNCGDAGDWNIQFAQSDDPTSWLHLGKTTGALDKHRGDTIPFTVSSKGVTPGCSYTITLIATITTANGEQDSTQITVTLNIMSPPE
ncbi:MAG TPA: hypothetical protein VGN34_04730, partial [Ktedonobacteraceae bacterium]